MRRKLRNGCPIQWEKMPWKPVDTSNCELGDFQDTVFFGLEELDGSVYANIGKDSSDISLSQPTLPVGEKCEIASSKENAAKKQKQKKKSNKKLILNLPENVKSDLTIDELPQLVDSNWGSCGKILLNSLLQSSLLNLGFLEPTPIQNAAIPHILQRDCDLVGAAETGSGKTLAFALPILHHLMKNWLQCYHNVCPYALLLAPTRELVLQIANVIRSVCSSLSHSNKYKINVVTIVGGMSEHKQKRQLSDSKNPAHIVVATPGRLCELFFNEDDVPTLQNLSSLSFLVVDEADRMLEDGHFPELQKIFGQIKLHEDLAKKGLNPMQVKAEAARGIDVEEDDDEEEEEVRGEVEELVDFDSMTKNDSTINIENRLSSATTDDNHDYEGYPTNRNSLTLPITSSYQCQRQTLLFSATAMASPLNNNNSVNKKRKRKSHPNTSFSSTSKNNLSEVMKCLVPSLRELLKSIAVKDKLEVADVTVPTSTITSDTNSNSSTTSNNNNSNSKSNNKEEEGEDGSKNSQKKKQKIESIKDTATATATAVTTLTNLPSGLTQYEVKCPTEEKDTMTYYVLTENPGRTLIFVNSIKSARRLDGLLRALGLPCRALHAQMQQKQRMKALEAFQVAPRSILVATDIASRGLDVALVQVVLHYDIARSPQLYQHRSGRTARAGRTGSTISMVTPEDAAYHAVICSTQNIKKLDSFPVKSQLLPLMHDKVKLAKKIFTLSFAEAQKSKQRGWLEKTAAEMDIEPDEVLAREEREAYGPKEAAARNKALVQDRLRLKQLLDSHLSDANDPRRAYRGKRSFVVVAK